MSEGTLASWPVVGLVTLLVHALALLAPLRLGDAHEPQEFIDFELAELPPLPEPPPPPEPEPEPEPPPKPPGPKNPDPTADPDVTSAESNRPAEEPPSEPVPLRTGLALEADQLAAEGMGVRVGNTSTAGFDADVAPGDLQGFVDGGAGGGEGDVTPPKPDESPKLVRSFQPDYPERMRRRGVEGRVLVRVRVLANGRAGEVTLLVGVHPDLDRVAVEAVKRFRWRPARLHGKRVEGMVELAIRFEIKD